MDILTLVTTQYAIPVVAVVICAVLVFVFGFKSAEEPDFDQLNHTGDDRKPAGKKRKLKDKKSQSNGHATAVGNSHAEVKANKSTAKVEKSPAKDASNKAVAKQQKKQESSPLKDKPFIKQKDNKNENDPTQKQLKEKKQDSAEKSPAKDNNKNVAAKQKGKGKENKAEEIKNKKNEKNLAKLKNAEGKPAGFDDGGWKEVLSSKDKKSRKKDEPEDIFPVKNVGKNEGGGKKEGVGKKEVTPPKKQIKIIELDLADIPAYLQNKELEKEKEIEKEEPKSLISEKSKKSEKQAEKEKPMKGEMPIEKTEVEDNSKGDKEVDEKVDVKEVEEIIVEIKSLEVESKPDAAAKSKKKNKKKKDEVMEVVEHRREIPDIIEVTVQKKLSESSDKPANNKKVKSVEVTKAVESVETEPAAVFDELGDVWKEAKVPKKNKKKVRKDQ